MEHVPPNPLVQLMPLRCLNISTRLRLHPEFVKAPGKFARRHGLDLVGEVSPATSFKNDGDTGEKTSSAKANIHLGQHGAIRLFTERDGDSYWVRGIELNPSVLLHGVKNCALVEQDLLLSLSMLKSMTTPLLADPLDACHIVPGLVNSSEHVAYWRAIVSEVLVPHAHLACLHGVNHPITGPAEGATKKRLQLGDKRDDCVIRFKHASWEAAVQSGTQCAHGILIKLYLRGQALLAMFGRPDTTASVDDTRRLVTFHAPDVARAHQEMMSRLVGSYLPVPPEWADTGKPVTHARTIALVSLLTATPIKDLRAVDENIRHLSRSTCQRLNNEVRVEAARLKPIPVVTLFKPEVYAALPEATFRTDGRIDPLVAAAYGPNI